MLAVARGVNLRPSVDSSGWHGKYACPCLRPQVEDRRRQRCVEPSATASWRRVARSWASSRTRTACPSGAQRLLTAAAYACYRQRPERRWIVGVTPPRCDPLPLQALVAFRVSTITSRAPRSSPSPRVCLATRTASYPLSDSGSAHAFIFSLPLICAWRTSVRCTPRPPPSSTSDQLEARTLAHVVSPLVRQASTSTRSPCGLAPVLERGRALHDVSAPWFTSPASSNEPVGAPLGAFHVRYNGSSGCSPARRGGV